MQYSGVMDEVRFARVEDASVAYALSGEPGAHDVVLMMGGTMPMAAIAEDEVGARLLDSLRGVGRVVLFDRRGWAMATTCEATVETLGGRAHRSIAFHM